MKYKISLLSIFCVVTLLITGCNEEVEGQEPNNSNSMNNDVVYEATEEKDEEKDNQLEPSENDFDEDTAMIEDKEKINEEEYVLLPKEFQSVNIPVIDNEEGELTIIGHDIDLDHQDGQLHTFAISYQGNYADAFGVDEGELQPYFYPGLKLIFDGGFSVETNRLPHVYLASSEEKIIFVEAIHNNNLDELLRMDINYTVFGEQLTKSLMLEEIEIKDNPFMFEGVKKFENTSFAVDMSFENDAKEINISGINFQRSNVILVADVTFKEDIETSITTNMHFPSTRSSTSWMSRPQQYYAGITTDHLMQIKFPIELTSADNEIHILIEEFLIVIDPNTGELIETDYIHLTQVPVKGHDINFESHDFGGVYNINNETEVANTFDGTVFRSAQTQYVNRTDIGGFSRSCMCLANGFALDQLYSKLETDITLASLRGNAAADIHFFTVNENNFNSVFVPGLIDAITNNDGMYAQPVKTIRLTADDPTKRVSIDLEGADQLAVVGFVGELQSDGSIDEDDYRHVVLHNGKLYLN